MVKIRPLKQRVVIERILPTAQTKSGLHIPEVAQEKTYQGLVTAVGPDVKQVWPGDHVFYDRLAGIEAKTEAGTFVVLQEWDVQGVLES